MKRPDGVTLIAVWYFLNAFFILLSFCALIAIPVSGAFSKINDQTGLFWATAGVICLAVIVAVTGIIAALTGWGLLRIRSWARTLALVLAIMGLFAFPVGTVISALIIWYLSKEDVRQVFVLVEEDAYLTGVEPSGDGDEPA
jgi:hypothetical protein